MSLGKWLVAPGLVLACAVTGCKPAAEQPATPSSAPTPNLTSTSASTVAAASSVVDPAAPDLTNSIGMRFKRIPAGEFLMGNVTEEHRNNPVCRLHPVTISQPFYLGMHEVTQAEYERVIGSNPSSLKGPQNPVETLSWEEAVEFCRRLSALPDEQAARRVYRLPTEAEWEYACRAGSATVYPSGDRADQVGKYAWIFENSGNVMQNRAPAPHPVGQKRPNRWGLFDMQGNVFEWCQDFYGDLPAAAVVDPQGPDSGSRRMVRGGCFFIPSSGCTSSSRAQVDPASRNNFLGFRVALGPLAD